MAAAATAAGTGTTNAGAASKGTLATAAAETKTEAPKGEAPKADESTSSIAAAGGPKDDQTAGAGKADDGTKSADTKAGDTKAGEAPAGTGKTDDSKSGDAGDGKPKPPEKYELTLPDGGPLDADDLKSVEELARTHGWSNEQAQQVLESHAEALSAQSARFLEQTEADATYGGEKLAETQRLAVKALNRVRPAGTPRGDALRQLLDKSGYGNHIEVISFLADLGRLMSEDTATGGAGTSGDAPKTAAEVLYGSN